MIDQAGWGSTKLYPDGGLSGLWNPKVIILHWGGLTSQVEPDKEDEILRGWQRYHTVTKGWRDIAYNYAVGDSGEMYRCRGENPSGATSGTSPDGERWNEIGVSIVWIGGRSDEDGPSEAAIATLVEYLDSRGLPVLGHVQTGKATSCPGPDLLRFVKDYNNGVYDVADYKTTSNPLFQPAWNKAIDTGFFSKYTKPTDVVTAEKLAVFLDRLGLLNTGVPDSGGSQNPPSSQPDAE